MLQSLSDSVTWARLCIMYITFNVLTCNVYKHISEINKSINPHNACVNCGIRPGDCKHFFLQCLIYQPARDILFAAVAPLLSDFYPNLNNLSNREKDSITNLFLQGDDRLILETNKQIFNQVFIYISSTQRMK